MAKISPNPRKIAVKVLRRITEDGAYADIALSKAVNEYSFSALDRALLTELVYGCVKYLRYLDYIISKFSRRPIDKLEPDLRNLLRLGLYQIFLLDQIPDAVAVFETVEAAKGVVHLGAQKFLNGLLRTVVRQRERVAADDFWPTESHELLGTKLSHPQWLVDRWIELWGPETTAEICQANNQTPPISLRVNTLKTTRAELLQEFARLGIRATAEPLTVEGINLSQGVAISKLAPLQSGQCFVQDVGSQLISHLLDPQPGERILDACSAPGGKTTHIAQLMHDRGEVVATDVNTARLWLVQDNCRVLGITCVRTEVQDAVLLHERSQWRQSFDRVLVDAPCTGTGVLRRRADLRWRKQLQDLTELPTIQKAIIASSAEMVKPGGVLVYSTCSIDPAENQEVIDWFLQRFPGWIVEDFRTVLDLPPDFGTALSQESPPEFLYLYPHREKTDGFFAARLRRR